MSSKFAILILSLSTLFFTRPAWSSRICYFSLNNEKEFQQMEKFSKKLNTVTKNPIEIKEYQTEGSDVEESFEAMVKSGVKCDGLVISGHHTGSFGGKRGDGQLDISFMEKLSCKAEYNGFFENVKALWLQGCRTLGVGKIEANDSADMHTERVGAVLAEDDLTQSFAQLNMEFSSTLDQDNPLSSRYLRVFPRANAFGWTKTAPGEKSKSEFSIPYHIAHIAHLNDDRGRYFENPVGDQINAKDLVQYVKAIDKLLESSDCSQCEEFNSGNKKTAKDIVLEAWMEQGDASKKYTLANADLNAYPSIYSSNDELLKKAKEIECFMKNSNDHEKIAKVIEEALNSEAMIGRSFHSIYEYMQRLKKEGKFAELEKLNKKLSESSGLQNYLMRKFASKELGILRKIDYYAFWKDMTGQNVEGIEKALNEYLFDLATKSNPSESIDQRDFIQTVFQSMIKNGLLKNETFMKIASSAKTNNQMLVEIAELATDSLDQKRLSNADGLAILSKILSTKRVDGAMMDRVVDAIRSVKVPITGTEELFFQILNSEKSDKGNLSSIAQAIRLSERPIASSEKILLRIMNSKKADAETLSAVAAAVISGIAPIAGETELLNKILSSEKTNARTLSTCALALTVKKRPFARAGELLNQILNSKKADIETFEAVSRAIGDLDEPLAGGEEMLLRIMNSKNADAETLSSVAYTIITAKLPIAGEIDLLKKLLSSEKLNARTLSRFAESIGYRKRPLAKAGEFLFQILSSEKADAGTLAEIARALARTKEPIKERDEILNKLLSSDKLKTDTLNSIAFSIVSAETPFVKTGEMLTKMISSEKATASTLNSVVSAICSATVLIGGREEIISKIVNSGKLKSFGLRSIADDIKRAKISFVNSQELLAQIEKRIDELKLK